MNKILELKELAGKAIAVRIINRDGFKTVEFDGSILAAMCEVVLAADAQMSPSVDLINKLCKLQSLLHEEMEDLYGDD